MKPRLNNNLILHEIKCDKFLFCDRWDMLGSVMVRPVAWLWKRSDFVHLAPHFRNVSRGWSDSFKNQAHVFFLKKKTIKLKSLYHVRMVVTWYTWGWSMWFQYLGFFHYIDSPFITISGGREGDLRLKLIWIYTDCPVCILNIQYVL